MGKKARLRRIRKERQTVDPNFVSNRALTTSHEEPIMDVVSLVMSKTGKERASTLLLICKACLVVLNKTAQAKGPVRLMVERSHVLYNAIASALFVESDVRTPLHLWRAVFGTFTVAERCKSVQQQMVFRICDANFFAPMEFLKQYLRFVGATVERTLTFVMQLTDEWSLRVQTKQDVAMVADVITRKHRAIQDMRAEDPDLYSQEVISRFQAVFTFLRGCLDISRDFDLALDCQQWAVNLIRAAASNPAAAEVLRSLLSILTVHTSAEPLQLYAGDVAQQESLQELLEYSLEAVGEQDLKKTAKEAGLPELSDEEAEVWLQFVQSVATQRIFPQVTLADKEAQTMLRDWCLEQVQRQKSTVDRAKQTLSYFRDSASAVEADIVERIDAIRMGMTRGLRSAGADHFEIRVDALRLAGVRAIVFYPENCVLPDTGVEVIVKQETPHLCVYRTQLCGSEFLLHERVLRNKHMVDPERDSPALQLMLKWVVVDMLHRVLLEKRELRPMKRKERNGGSESGEHLTSHPVRPTVRTLPEGHKASAAALERAAAANYSVPAGKTFVQGHIRGANIEYDLPTEPIGFYDDDDLIESGLQLA